MGSSPLSTPGNPPLGRSLGALGAGSNQVLSCRKGLDAVICLPFSEYLWPQEASSSGTPDRDSGPGNVFFLQGIIAVSLLIQLCGSLRVLGARKGRRMSTPRPGCLDVTVMAFAEGPRKGPPFLPGQGPSPTGRLGAWTPGQEGPPLPSPHSGNMTLQPLVWLSGQISTRR